MVQASLRVPAGSQRKAAKKKRLRLEIRHVAVIPKDPVVTFRVLTAGRHEMTNMTLIGLPARATLIKRVPDRGPGFSENAARVTLSNGISFIYRETARSPGKFFGAQLSEFTGFGTVFVDRVISEWSLTPRAMSGNAIGATEVQWTIKFYPRNIGARWIMHLWLSLHWRHVSADEMMTNMRRVVDADPAAVLGRHSPRYDPEGRAV